MPMSRGYMRALYPLLMAPLQPPPPWGEWSLGAKSIGNTFCKAPKVPKLIHTVILWHSSVVQSPPPPSGYNE